MKEKEMVSLSSKQKLKLINHCGYCFHQFLQSDIKNFKHLNACMSLLRLYTVLAKLAFPSKAKFTSKPMFSYNSVGVQFLF